MLGRASVSRVRRGVPNVSAISSSSSETSCAHARRLGEQRLELVDLGAQLVALGLELDAAELREAAQLQLEDVVGLHLRSGRRRPCRRVRACVGVVARADDLDDLVDVEDRDEQALDEVQALLAAGEAVLASGA